MSFSWTAVCILLLFITPGVPFLFWIRFAMPRSTTATLKDSNLLIAGMAVGAILNFELFGYIAKAFCEQISSDLPPSSWHKPALKFFLQQEFHPWRPTIRFLETFHLGPISRTSLPAFVTDLHVRTFICGMGVAAIIIAIWWLDDWREARAWKKLILERPHSKHVAEIVSEKSKLTKLLTWVQSAYLHPWALLTLYNRQRELLMLDVLTKDTGMYSGVFSSYVPDGMSISAVAMEYCVLYEGDSSERREQLAAGNKPSPREKTLIKNNGEIVIPVSNVLNFHFWELRKGFVVNIGASNKTWLAVLMQFALLARLFPGYIRQINVHIGIEDKAERRKFLVQFTSFASANGISMDETSIIKFLLPKSTA